SDRIFPPERELVTGVLHVGDVDRLQIADGAAGHRGAAQRHRFFPRHPPELAERRGHPEHLVIDDEDIDNLRLANAGGVLGYRVKHRLHVTRRIGDYAENVTDGLLLLREVEAREVAHEWKRASFSVISKRRASLRVISRSHSSTRVSRRLNSCRPASSKIRCKGAYSPAERPPVTVSVSALSLSAGGCQAITTSRSVSAGR